MCDRDCLCKTCDKCKGGCGECYDDSLDKCRSGGIKECQGYHNEGYNANAEEQDCW